MRIADHVEALELPMRMAGGQSTIWPAVLWDEGGEATLIDTGVPGLSGTIEGLLSDLGPGLKAVRRIILTHQDIDHIGSAPALVAATGAQVLAHGDDVPYIQGERRLIKLDPKRFEERMKGRPEAEREALRRLLADPPRVRVDRRLIDGEELPWHGGIVVVHTPGHTPGHVCLYLKASRVLIAGDALRVEEGRLVGPSAAATPDLPAATASLRKLLPFDIEQVLCYHGGLASGDAPGRLRALAG